MLYQFRDVSSPVFSEARKAKWRILTDAVEGEKNTPESSAKLF